VVAGVGKKTKTASLTLTAKQVHEQDQDREDVKFMVDQVLLICV